MEFPKKIYVQRYNQNDDEFLCASESLLEALEADAGSMAGEHVGIYELIETGRILEGKPKFIKDK